RCREGLVVLLDHKSGLNADRADDPVEELPDRGREIALVGGRLGTVRVTVGCDGRDHPRGREAHPEQPPLALGDDLKLDRGLVEPRTELLQLTERRPLGLADRLACGLDLQLVAHRRARLLRLTLRGCCRAAGWAWAGSRFAAPSPAGSGSVFGAVRDERRCG